MNVKHHDQRKVLL